MESIIVAIITSVCALLGVILTNHASNVRMEESIKVNQAVTNTKLEALTNAVNKHNNFAQRMPVVEEQIKVINHRIDDLEKNEKNK